MGPGLRTNGVIYFSIRAGELMNKINRDVLIFMLVILMLLSLPGNIFAREDDKQRQGDGLFTKKVSLDQMLAYATGNNPSIQVEIEKWRAVVEKYRVATAYPDPQFMVTWFPSPIETRLGPQDWNATLSQMIPFPGKLSTSGEIVKTEAVMAKLATDGRVRAIRSQVTRSFHELLYIQKARDIARKNAILLVQLRQMAEAAHADDRTALMDVLKAQSQGGQLQYDVLLLEELEHTEKTTLNGLLNRPPDAGLGELLEFQMVPLSCPLTTLYELPDSNQEGIPHADLKG